MGVAAHREEFGTDKQRCHAVKSRNLNPESLKQTQRVKYGSLYHQSCHDDNSLSRSRITPQQNVGWHFL